MLEDHNQKIQIHGLENRYVGSAEEAQEVIRYGNSVRTTHCTAANDTSSRSHAICTVSLILRLRSLLLTQGGEI